jgi:hypothetical protein
MRPLNSFRAKPFRPVQGPEPVEGAARLAKWSGQPTLSKSSFAHRASRGRGTAIPLSALFGLIHFDPVAPAAIHPSSLHPPLPSKITRIALIRFDSVGFDPPLNVLSGLRSPVTGFEMCGGFSRIRSDSAFPSPPSRRPYPPSMSLYQTRNGLIGLIHLDLALNSPAPRTRSSRALGVLGVPGASGLFQPRARHLPALLPSNCFRPSRFDQFKALSPSKGPPGSPSGVSGVESAHPIRVFLCPLRFPRLRRG